MVYELMGFISELKGLSNKVINSVYADADVQTSILTQIESLFYDLELKESLSSVHLDPGHSTNVVNPRASLNLNQTLVRALDSIHTDLLSSFKSFDSPVPFMLKSLKALAPVIGHNRFFSTWWSECFKRWLERSGVELRHLVAEVLTEYLHLGGGSSAEGVLAMIDYYNSISSFNWRHASENEGKVKFIGTFESVSQSDPSKILKRVLSDFGSRNPKALFECFSLSIKRPETRLAALDILLEFLSEKSYCASEIGNSSLLEVLFYALLLDEALRVLDAASSIITMLLPYVLPKRSELLPLFMVALVRSITCYASGISRVPRLNPDEPSWDSLPNADNKLTSNIPTQFFTLLYGMYPRNLVMFIRSPRRYFERSTSATEGWYDQLLKALDLGFIEEAAVNNVGRRLLMDHQVIPELLLENVDCGLVEQSPMLNLEPMEIVSLCLERRIERDRRAEDQSSIEDVSVGSTIHKLAQIHLELEASLAGFSSSQLETADGRSSSELWTLVHSVRCELYLERFLRRHQSEYIRHFHREQLTESSSGAERHSLYSACRALHQEVKLLKQTLERTRTESSASQAKHIKWENELNQKLKHYRGLTRDLRAKNYELQTELQALNVKN